MRGTVDDNNIGLLTTRNNKEENFLELREPPTHHLNDEDGGKDELDIKIFNDDSFMGQIRIMLSPIFNLLNVILGAGVLGLGYALMKAGLVSGIILLLLVGAATQVSYMFLLWSAEYSQVFTYKALARRSFGKVVEIVVDIIIIIDALGTLSAYQILVADSVSLFFTYYNIHIPRNAIIGLTSIITVPLCLLKNISWLGFSSFLSLLPLMYLIALQIYYLSHLGSPGHIILFGDYKGFFLALPIFIFSYSSQSAFFPIYNDLKLKSQPQHITKVVNCSIVLTAVIYVLCGAMSVSLYPHSSKGNVMLNLPAGTPVHILFFTMAFSIILSFPVIIWPIRDSISQLLVSFREKVRAYKTGETTPPLPSPTPPPFSWPPFIIITLVILSLTLVFSITIPSFVTVLGLVGAITKVFICYLLPPMFYLRINWMGANHDADQPQTDTPASPFPSSSSPHDIEIIKKKNEKKSWFWVILALSLIFFGIVVGGFSSVITVIHYIDLHQPKKMKNKFL